MQAVGAALDQFPAGQSPSLYTFGIGGDHNADLLKGLADAANSGSYFFIENEELIPESFASALGGLMSVVAQNLLLRIETADGVTIAKEPMLGKKNDVDLSLMPRGLGIRIGDIFSEERKDFLIDLALPKSDLSLAFHAATIKLAYFDVDQKRMVDISQPLLLPRPAQAPAGQVEHTLVTAERNRILYNRAVTEATRLADAGRNSEARKIIETAIKGIKMTVGDEASEGLVEDLKDTLKDIGDSYRWESGGKHYTMSMQMANVQQRSAMSMDSPSSSRYQEREASGAARKKAR